MAGTRQLGETLRRFGLALPGAYEAHPWGELVLKTKGKVFVFLGKPDVRGKSDELSFSVKLPESGERLLDQDDCEPTAYGLGKSGWVTIRAGTGSAFSSDELCALIEESYRSVAPKALVKELDDGGAKKAPAAELPEVKKKPAKATRKA